MLIFLKKFYLFIVGNELPSKSKKLFLEMSSNSIKQQKMFQFTIITHCCMDEDEKGVTEADKLWVFCRTLMDRGYIHKVTCYKKSATAELRIFSDGASDIMSIVDICDIIYKEVDYSRFLYFITSQKKKYRYSPQGELYEHFEKFISQKYVFEKFINTSKSSRK